ncbi:MAG: DUF4209 domain-containing protein [Candidatus Korobacteraceae bacterium]|jgi:uncharacterized protein DUF4209
MPLRDEVLSWLDEPDNAPDSLDLVSTTQRVILRMEAANATEDEIRLVLRVLAPLEFLVRRESGGAWGSYFAPRQNAIEGVSEEYPKLADLNATDVEEWVLLATQLKKPILRARFSDAIWELGTRLGSPREDKYQFGLLAAEMYLEAANNGLAEHSFLALEAGTRSIELALQFNSAPLIQRAFEFMMSFADSAEPAHIGHWFAPFDRLIGLKGLGPARRNEIVEKLELRFRDSIKRRDLHHMTMAGQALAEYFNARQQYDCAKEITLAYGEPVLDIASGLGALTAVHHIESVLAYYRRVGLREEADRVRLLLEKRGKDVIAEMKEHRVEMKLDLKEIEDWLAGLINVSNPFVAFYRLASCCAPDPDDLGKRLDRMAEQFVSLRLFPASIIGDDGLTVTTVEDKEGRMVMEFAREMNLGSTFFLAGVDEWKKKFALGSIPGIPELFDSPLIPEDRVPLYRDGLLAFEKEDYVKAIHVLIPQIENSLRELLKLLDIPISKTAEDGGFDFKNMNDVLHDPRVRETLDERLWYFLKVLYTDKRGMKLRNLVAHGVAPLAVFNRPTAALVIQSVAFLTIIRVSAVFISEEDDPKQPK